MYFKSIINSWFKKIENIVRYSRSLKVNVEYCRGCTAVQAAESCSRAAGGVYLEKTSTFPFAAKRNRANLTQQFRQTQHLSREHAQADEDGVELADGASYVPGSDLPQVHGKHAESHTCQEEKGI